MKSSKATKRIYFYTPIWWANLTFKVYFKYRFTKCDVKNKEYQNWCDRHLIRHFVKKFSISRSWRGRWRFFLVSVWWGWRTISGWMSEKMIILVNLYDFLRFFKPIRTGLKWANQGNWQKAKWSNWRKKIIFLPTSINFNCNLMW